VKIKPVVYFEELEGIYPYDDEEYAVLLNVKQHPVLGTCPWVRTSTVVGKTFDMETKETVEIQTLNTVYKRRNDA
jgi:hypothetical protein